MKRHLNPSAGMRLGGLLAVAAAGASAQTVEPPAATNARAFYVTPSVAVQATVSDNIDLASTNPRSDLILEFIPRLQVGGQSGRVKGFLDYALTASAYARNRDESNFQNALNAQLRAEVVENWFYVDANASISQENISVFGSQSPDSSLLNDNRTEVTTVNISPFLTGQIGGAVDYKARVNFEYNDSGSSQAPNSSTWSGELNLAGSTRQPKLGWKVDMTYSEYDFEDQEKSTNQFLVGSLIYAATPYLKLSVRANVEKNTITGPDTQSTSGWGWGLNWNPSPRTLLFAEQDQRFFGESHNLGFDYRTPRTVWRISSRRGLTDGSYNPGRVGSGGSPFDQLFAQFARVEPDPVLREQLVNFFMQSNGISATDPLNRGYLPQDVTDERRNEASVTWVGSRSTFTFNVYDTESSTVTSASAVGSDFANGNVINWRGFGVNWSHRLTPQTTLRLSGAQERTTESLGVQETDLKTVDVMLTTQLSQRAQASISARHTRFSSDTAPYRESALIANLTLRF